MVTRPPTTPNSIAALLVAVKLALVVPLAIVAAIGDSGSDDSIGLVGCLRPGTEKGTFVLTNVAPAPGTGTIQNGQDDGSSPRRPNGTGADTPAMSTAVGLTAHVGERVAVRGRMGENKRHGTVLKIRSLKVVDQSCG
jgi:hypothetical protein